MYTFFIIFIIFILLFFKIYKEIWNLQAYCNANYVALPVLNTQIYEPYRVSEFREFANEVPPTEARHPQSGWIVGIVDRLTFIAVVQQPSGH